MKTERTIRNCRIATKAQCPRECEQLKPTGNDNVRSCNACGDDVFWCSSDEETLRHARAGHCIAREQPHPAACSPIVIGRPEFVPPTDEQRAADAWIRRERGIDDALKTLERASVDCVGCGYPMPAWRKTCKVCGRTMGVGDSLAERLSQRP